MRHANGTERSEQDIGASGSCGGVEFCLPRRNSTGRLSAGFVSPWAVNGRRIGHQHEKQNTTRTPSGGPTWLNFGMVSTRMPWPAFA